ncbi:helix-turn-helix transcriptional regulator [Streptomyces sp. AV19]|uniref:helix-turn-helix transcriptional regulator n=1 Tax=Streptomyces sp. AV19 TaxID=2793068 RepID=UPI001F1CCDDD|nr:helix-turn-helix transcriptional regulator [Streptomyces sp. AV19]MDG4536827.1 helix-turn-helix transcriptional regulator [Streptomyces sp. AV19]
MDDETFAQALRRLRGNLSQRALARLAHCGKSYIGDLETGRRHPSPELAAVLDRVLDAGGYLVHLAMAPAAADVLQRAAALQQGLGEHLAAGPMSDAGVEDWEYTVERHGRATRYRSERPLLGELVDDFAVLQPLLSPRQRHSSSVRRRLTVVAARLSGLMALTLLKSGEPMARAWWRTGRQLAGVAEDRPTLSWIYAQEAYQQYYNGDMYGAVELGNRARRLAGGLPCVGPALAAPLQARAYAALHQAGETAAALAEAQSALDRLDPAERTASAFGYSESQLRFHGGNAWTHLGETRRARENHERALELYPASELTDRALVQLDQAVCLASDGDTAAAATHAVATLTALPEEHRSALIVYRAKELATTVPATRQKLPEVRELHEMLALPGGEG